MRDHLEVQPFPPPCTHRDTSSLRSGFWRLPYSRAQPPGHLSCCGGADPPKGSDSPGWGGMQERTDLTPRSSPQPHELELCPVPCTRPVGGDSYHGVSCLEAGSSDSTWEGQRPEITCLVNHEDTEGSGHS